MGSDSPAFACRQGIVVLPQPKRLHRRLERDIEEILEHETVHLVLRFRVGLAATRRFDRLFPCVGDLERWKET